MRVLPDCTCLDFAQAMLTFCALTLVPFLLVIRAKATLSLKICALHNCLFNLAAAASDLDKVGGLLGILNVAEKVKLRACL